MQYGVTVQGASRKSRVVVLTLPLGGGHSAAAKAIAWALHQANVRVEVVDISTEIYSSFTFDKILSLLYRAFTTWRHGIIHLFLYTLADRHSKVTLKVINAVFGRQVSKWIRRTGEVDVFVSTHAVISYVLGRQLVEPNRSSVVSFVTDAGHVNKIWFEGNIDKFIVFDQDTRRLARATGIPAGRLAVMSPPVAITNDLATDRTDARRQLGLDARFTVLVTAGGAGLGRGALKAAQLLADSRLNVQLILNAGTNERLRRRFLRLSADRDFLVMGFTANFPVLLMACDLVIGKAGWLTINEAIAACRPTLIVDILPGQEGPNCAFAENIGMARKINPDEVLWWVKRYTDSSIALSSDFALGGMSVHNWSEDLREALKDLVMFDGSDDAGK